MQALSLLQKTVRLAKATLGSRHSKVFEFEVGVFGVQYLPSSRVYVRASRPLLHSICRSHVFVACCILVRAMTARGRGTGVYRAASERAGGACHSCVLHATAEQYTGASASRVGTVAHLNSVSPSCLFVRC